MKPKVACPDCAKETIELWIDGIYEPDTNAGGDLYISSQSCACTLTEAQMDAIIADAERTLTAEDFAPEPVYSWE